MIQWLKDLFSESSTVSSMRVMSITTCFSALFLAFKDPTAVTMVSALLSSAFIGKVAQKVVESKS